MCLLVFMARRTLWVIFAVDIGRIIGVSDDKGSSKFLGLHVVFLDQFPMNKTGIGTTVDEGVFLDAALPLV